MPRSGTLVFCVHNLDFSGANQVVLNIIQGRMHESNVVVISPKPGTFASRFVESGAAVRIGEQTTLLDTIRDVFCIACNTLLTADIVVSLSRRKIPIVWIIHEWWTDDLIEENLRLRNLSAQATAQNGGMTVATVKDAMSKASMIVFVCERQRQLYSPPAPSTVIFVGVPPPVASSALGIENGDSCPPQSADGSKEPGSNAPLPAPNEKSVKDRLFTILVLGIVCPRKNQLWAVEIFKAFAVDKAPGSVRMQVIGARYTRSYEVEYLKLVADAIGSDERIELRDVTDNVDPYYSTADCLLCPSLNEVTPMVISEALSWGIPVLSTNIAGIPEMFTDGVEGFLFPAGDTSAALSALETVYRHSPSQRKVMRQAARARYTSVFDIDLMVDKYRQLLFRVAPPVVLIDMDGTLVDWDAGFSAAWRNRSPIDRTRSYFMEQCVSSELHHEAELLIHSQGFFEGLPAMIGGIEALKEMRDVVGLSVYLVTAPILTSRFCAQEKINWVRKHLGEVWLDKLILCYDKTAVRGDILIDDKPFEFLTPGGRHNTASWKQVLYDAPYNRHLRSDGSTALAMCPRLCRWSDWRSVVLPLLGSGSLRVQDSPEIASSLSATSSLPSDTASIPMTLTINSQSKGAAPYRPPQQPQQASIQSPRSIRLRDHSMSLSESQQRVDMYLGLQQHDDDISILSAEDAASISGTGSFFLDTGDADHVDDSEEASRPLLVLHADSLISPLTEDDSSVGSSGRAAMPCCMPDRYTTSEAATTMNDSTIGTDVTVCEGQRPAAATGSADGSGASGAQATTKKSLKAATASGSRGVPSLCSNFSSDSSAGRDSSDCDALAIGGGAAAGVGSTSRWRCGEPCLSSLHVSATASAISSAASATAGPLIQSISEKQMVPDTTLLTSDSQTLLKYHAMIRKRREETEQHKESFQRAENQKTSDSDSQELDGLQLRRQSYQQWRVNLKQQQSKSQSGNKL